MEKSHIILLRIIVNLINTKKKNGVDLSLIDMAKEEGSRHNPQLLLPSLSTFLIETVCKFAYAECKTYDDLKKLVELN